MYTIKLVEEAGSMVHVARGHVGVAHVGPEVADMSEQRTVLLSALTRGF